MPTDLTERAVSLQVAALQLENRIYGDNAGGSFAAFLLALDYIGRYLVLIPGRPGFDLTAQGRDGDYLVFGVAKPSQITEMTMITAHSAPEWKQDVLAAVLSLTKGEPLTVGTLATPSAVVLPDQNIGVMAAIALQIPPPLLSFVIGSGDSLAFVHLVSPGPIISPETLEFLAEEGYRRSCGDPPREDSDKVFCFDSRCRENFRQMREYF